MAGRRWNSEQHVAQPYKSSNSNVTQPRGTKPQSGVRHSVGVCVEPPSQCAPLPFFAPGTAFDPDEMLQAMETKKSFPARRKEHDEKQQEETVLKEAETTNKSLRMRQKE